MPDDPIFVALQRGRPLTLEVARLAIRHRLARIDELWAEVRVLEEIVGSYPAAASALAERDPPIETAERTRH